MASANEAESERKAPKSASATSSQTSALVTSGLMLGVYTIVKAADYGWGSAHTLLFGAAAVALLAGFIARQATSAKPLLPLRILRNRNVAGANLIQVLMVAGMFGMFFLGALYLEKVLHYDPLQIGLAFRPTCSPPAIPACRTPT